MDARGEFLNSGQLDALSGIIADSFQLLDAVNRITSSFHPRHQCGAGAVRPAAGPDRPWRERLLSGDV
ncbi:MAG: hypothetical protein ER33_06840 [Cyanobium sp. CACIAM 14]|nr:MAG: hypothetical protein ER33_06840 [Cyanobium sp. CACIAM 14]